MLEKIKQALRIKSNAFDDELKDLITAAKLNLEICGIAKSKIIDTDPLIIQAVKTYCKANFGLDNKDSEKYQKSYDMIKTHLALCGDYNVE